MSAGRIAPRLTTEEILKRARNDATLAATPAEVVAFREAGGSASLDKETGFVAVDFKGWRDSSDWRIRLFDQLGRLTRIRRLRVGNGGKFADEAVATIADHSVLIEVDLGHTQLTDRGLARLSEFSRLEEMNLSSTRITDEGLASCRVLSHLAILSLSGTGVTSRGVAHLSRLPALRSLDLSYTNLSNEVVEALHQIPNLQILSLAGTLVNDSAIQSLLNHKGLRSLSLAKSLVTSRGIGSLKLERPDLDVAWSPSVNLIGYWRKDQEALARAMREVVDDRNQQEKHGGYIIHPRWLVDPSWEKSRRPAIVGYLTRAPVVAHFRGLSYCRFGCGWNGSTEQSDGVWHWPSGLAHYVQHHDVRLPDEFLWHMQEQDFQSPRFVAEPRFGMTTSTAFWRMWCRQQIRPEAT